MEYGDGTIDSGLSVWPGAFLTRPVASSSPEPPPSDHQRHSFLSHMEHIPNGLIIIIFEQFLPPLITAYDTAAACDLPPEEQIELFKNLVFCKLVCRRWREILEGYPSIFSRDAYYVTEGSLTSRDGLITKGEHVKRLAVEDTKECGSTTGCILAVFPNVVYISWTCKISWDDYYRSCKAAYSPLKHLKRLDWRLCGWLGASVKSFIQLVQHSPVLEYITLTVAEISLRGFNWQDRFDIPDSVTTLGLFFHPPMWRLGWWVGTLWFTGPKTSLKHLITSGMFRPSCNFSTIELRPDPCSTTQPTDSALRDFLRDRLPQDDSTKGTFIYSGATYAPPDSHDPVATKRLKWVHKIVLKTSGSCHKTEGERWNAVRRHLDFILKQFRDLESIDLCGDFQRWREDEAKGEVLEAFEESAQELGIAVGYIRENS